MKRLIKSNEILVRVDYDVKTAESLKQFIAGAIDEYEDGNDFCTEFMYEKLKYVYKDICQDTSHPPFNHYTKGKIYKSLIPNSILKMIKKLSKHSLTPHLFEFENSK